MRLMEILKEVELIEKDETLEEARKKAKKSVKEKIKTRYKAKSKQAEKIATQLKARKGKISWTDDIKDLRNNIVSAFMADDSEKVLGMLAGADGYKTVEILKALETAHGGYDKLERKAGKAGKKGFIKSVFAYIDDSETEE